MRCRLPHPAWLQCSGRCMAQLPPCKLPASHQSCSSQHLSTEMGGCQSCGCVSIFRSAAEGELCAPWVWLQCLPGLSGSVSFAAQRCLGKEGHMGQVVPIVWEPGDIPRLPSERAVTQAREGTKNCLSDPRALRAPASLGATPKEAQVFPGKDMQRPWGKGVFEAQMM